MHNSFRCFRYLSASWMFVKPPRSVSACAWMLDLHLKSYGRILRELSHKWRHWDKEKSLQLALSICFAHCPVSGTASFRTLLVRSGDGPSPGVANLSWVSQWIDQWRYSVIFREYHTWRGVDWQQCFSFSQAWHGEFPMGMPWDAMTVNCTLTDQKKCQNSGMCWTLLKPWVWESGKNKKFFLAFA